MNPERTVAVFCSANSDIDPRYNQAARAFTRAACAAGIGLVTGGTVRGTMGVISEEAARCGGYHLGVIPRFMNEWVHPGLSQLIWTDTMAQRKERMREGTFAVVALPGGIGTLDELVETYVLRKLHRYEGRLYALDVDGFYTPFKQLLDHYVETGMLEPSDRALIAFPTDVEELMQALQTA